MRFRGRLALLFVPVLLAAGCGAQSKSPFAAAPTAECLSGKGYRVSTRDADVGLVAATAARGGLRAVPPDGNTLTIAFADTSGDAEETRSAFRRFAPKPLQRHFSDVARVQRNAVMVWTTSPSQDALDTVMHCLKT
ncbi:MAG TPA: hypothetical protein VGF23_11720 [Gaiellaceae bacterium]